MNKVRAWFRWIFFLAVTFLAFLWLNNTSMFMTVPEYRPAILAHRGLAQTFPMTDIKWNTNTAAIIYPPEHAYLENTIPSMRAAFECGADLVEFDLRMTRDQKFAVFHDYLLDYRTDGKGNVSDCLMDDLRRLDAGFGYTHDGGVSFLFRGKGIGQIVAFEDILRAFPDRQFLVHVKDSGKEVGAKIVALLQEEEPASIDRLSFYGDHEALIEIKARFPGIRILSKQTAKKALLHYLLFGWTGWVPPATRGDQVFVPIKWAPLLWGWPTKFFHRMNACNTRVVLVAGSGEWSEGFDRPEDLALIPNGFSGYIWTNRADRIVPLLKGFRGR